jgi:hypothetical protein
MTRMNRSSQCRQRHALMQHRARMVSLSHRDVALASFYTASTLSGLRRKHYGAYQCVAFCLLAPKPLINLGESQFFVAALFMLCRNLPVSCMLYRNLAAYLRPELIQVVNPYGSGYPNLMLITVNMSFNHR